MKERAQEKVREREQEQESKRREERGRNKGRDKKKVRTKKEKKEKRKEGRQRRKEGREKREEGRKGRKRESYFGSAHWKRIASLDLTAAFSFSQTNKQTNKKQYLSRTYILCIYVQIHTYRKAAGMIYA